MNPVTSTHAAFPPTESLVRALTVAFDCSEAECVTVLDRRPNTYASTYASEIVTCLMSDSNEIRLFCKYGSRPHDTVYGHRAGVPYEAAVYEQVLRSCPMSALHLYGEYRHPNSDETWLFLEYLDDGVWVDKTLEKGSMELAARWLGRFHTLNEARASRDALAFLKRYDLDFYLGWARRTAKFAAGLHFRVPWLVNVCAEFEDLASCLVDSPPTVIHGEFYPQNILYQRQTVYPVDWESAATAAGEIDLASLTEDWSRDIAQQLEREYINTRWPCGAPGHFHQMLKIARMYTQFRWLGDRPEWTTDGHCLWRFEALRAAADELGLI